MIQYHKDNNVFTLQTQNASYVIGLWNDRLYHLHFGKKVNTIYRNTEQLLSKKEVGFSALDPGLQPGCSSDLLPMEYPTYGAPDLRIPALGIQYASGSRVTALRYEGYEVTQGKGKPEGLPGLYTEPGDKVQTLTIWLKDASTGVRVALYYTCFYDCDAIVRRVVVENGGQAPICLNSALSMSFDMIDGGSYEFLHLHGVWGRERTVQRQPLFNGTQLVDSKRGSSSHNHNPFFALLQKGADERQGEIFGFNLIYSGNFAGGVELDGYNTARVFLGINPFDFSYTLEPGERFDTPEAVMVYSGRGLGQMSRNFHRLYRSRLCRGPYRDVPRYVLLNNWEATYFQFDQEKLLEIGRNAVKMGVDMLVLDDGWFGKRDNDCCSIGDWVANRRKLPEGLDGLSRKLHEMGLKFGLWMEPEMVSPDSDLFRAHPDWCIHTKGVAPSLGRNQLILDYSRADVCDYMIDTICHVLNSTQIDYIKWDMNRNMTEIGSASLPPQRQAEVPHRYMLGLYRVMETVTARFPQVLFEGCSGGGGRFDPGILHYMPQIWTSDVSDAVERLCLQYGTSMVYPFSAMGAHVSAVPNHQVGRVTPFSMRGHVAMMGQFGYELDPAALSDEEIEESRRQIALYRRIEPTVHGGDCYRLRNPFEEDVAAFQFISPGGEEVVLFLASKKAHPNAPFQRICLEALDAEGQYEEEGGQGVLSGGELMALGIPFVNDREHFSQIRIFHKRK